MVKRRMKDRSAHEKTARMVAANDNSDGIGGQWYVVHAKAFQLDGLECDIEAAGFPAYVPRNSRMKRAGRKKRLDRSPLFGDYVFVRINPTPANISRLFQMPGFGGILVDGDNHLIPMKPADMDAMRRYEADPDWQKRDRMKVYVSGAKVRVKQGMFADSVGEIEQLLGKLADVDAEQRIKVAIPAFGGSVHMAFEASEIELI